MERKEAIERIKTRFDKWALDDEDVKAIQTLIPELREPEDKDVQMCNALWNLLKILYAQDSTMTEVGIQAGKFRDWLEFIRDRVNLHKEPHFTKRNALFDKGVENCDPGVMEKVSDKVDMEEAIRLGYENGRADAMKDLPRWKKWENGACGNCRGIPIAIVKRGLNGYELVDALGITGEQYIRLSDLEKLPGFKEDEKWK